jgi:hypothetical protein
MDFSSHSHSDYLSTARAKFKGAAKISSNFYKGE